MPTLREVRLRHASYYKEVLWKAEALYLKGHQDLFQGINLFDTDWPNIQQGQAWAAESSTEDQTILQLRIAYAQTLYCLELRLAPAIRIKWHETALRAANQLQMPAHVVEQLYYIGRSYVDSRTDMELAIGILSKAYQMGYELGNLRFLGSITGQIGLAYGVLGDGHKSFEHHAQELKLAYKLPNQRDLCQALNNMGSLAIYYIRQPPTAFKYLEESLALAADIGDPKLKAATLGLLSTAYLSWGTFKVGYVAMQGQAHARAIDCLNQALQIFRELNDRRGEINIITKLGLTYQDMQSWDEAIAFHLQALQLAQNIGYEGGEAMAYGNLSFSYHETGELVKALSYGALAAQIFERNGDSKSVEKMRAMMAEWLRNPPVAMPNSVPDSVKLSSPEPELNPREKPVMPVKPVYSQIMIYTLVFLLIAGIYLLFRYFAG